ncbi:putative ribonuclease H-like domain-containing protein [Tanacetum coccineum]
MIASKGIRMEYLPQTFWSQRDKVNARAMIQAIDKRLKTRRIMRSLERFVGGRPYGAGNPVKKILLKLNLSDHRLCKMVMECQSVKVKNFKKDATLKLFKNVSAVKGQRETAVKPSAGLPHRALQTKGLSLIVMSKHMIGRNTPTFYQDFNGVPVALEEVKVHNCKGIKREYSNAKTPQQNGVAERKNKTLIEAARTMLADSFLPNTFWAEAVSTACYVLNRVLVTKPQNKTPYELITGKIPIISYIRPFGCHVTILNTIDHLGKFDGKSDEGFLVGSENQANKHAGPKEANHSAVKSSEAKNEGEKPNKNTDEKLVDKEDQAFLDELKRQEKDANDAAEALRKEELLSTEMESWVDAQCRRTAAIQDSGKVWILSVLVLDSDYAGENLDRKSTTGGCQFLGRRLISWQYKKQTIVTTSTTEAEYVAAANCCGQVLWSQNQMLDYRFNFMNTKIYIDNESTICIVKNLVFHSKTKHIAIRHHFIRDAYEKKLIQVLKIYNDDNVVDLLTKAFDVSRF